MRKEDLISNLHLSFIGLAILGLCLWGGLGMVALLVIFVIYVFDLEM